MAKQTHTKFTPIFEGRTVRAVVTDMIDNVVTVAIGQAPRRKGVSQYCLASGAVLVRAAR